MSVQPTRPGVVVVAVDPGKVTGWALFDTETGAMETGGIEGRYAFYAWLRGIAAYGRPLELVTELFTITARTIATDRDMNALYINGFLDAAAEVNGWPLTFQQPGAAKGFSSNEKLGLLGWRKPMPGGHADDAARHLLLYLGTKRREWGEPLLRRIIEGGLS